MSFFFLNFFFGKKNTFRDVTVNHVGLNLGRHQFVVYANGQLDPFVHHSIHCFEKLRFVYNFLQLKFSVFFDISLNMSIFIFKEISKTTENLSRKKM